MSQSSTRASTDPEGYMCTNCGRFVKFTICQSDANGNCGWLIARCKDSNKEGVPCNFFRFKKGSTKSPASLPNPSLSTSTTIGVLPASAPPTVPSDHSAQAPTDACPTAGCGQKHIAPLCPQRLCCKHCRQLGGCLVKTHLPDKVSPPTNVPPPSLDSLPALASLPHQPPSSLLPLAQAQSLPPQSPDQLCCKQELLEDRHQRDAECIQNEKCSKQSLIVYTWNQDASPPLIQLFQAGFTWPFFILTTEIISLIGLADAADHGGLQMYETASLGAWVHIDGGHTLEPELTTNNPIELSDGEERRWPGDFFVDKVVPGLQEHKKTTKGQHKAAFEQWYPGVVYHCSTVFNEVKKWKEALAQLKDVCLGGERI
ncbi:uncharacterized protein LACBIDRAFT_329390 [Laccaria bicolor S238N-H82]|uniref:Predicted protein n=1 Tax=Laccaria bicolor (strain S238N-H82 / ATCC MYA-4686) TaxID=486041 RepID=B0DHV5_LACBS|nr:uncharacterized protein LACBIDRAFT_329390 [Laccaria bicolor S238N-H82]EDR05796.1 predicted protein [Laccaria bicolor S238N-H82]|eukprot:XP_001883472.1 predicted protein [Laccaria bicolor S238N-H82]